MCIHLEVGEPFLVYALEQRKYQPGIRFYLFFFFFLREDFGANHGELLDCLVARFRNKKQWLLNMEKTVTSLSRQGERRPTCDGRLRCRGQES